MYIIYPCDYILKYQPIGYLCTGDTDTEKFAQLATAHIASCIATYVRYRCYSILNLSIRGGGSY